MEERFWVPVAQVPCIELCISTKPSWDITTTVESRRRIQSDLPTSMHASPARYMTEPLTRMYISQQVPQAGDTCKEPVVR